VHSDKEKEESHDNEAGVSKQEDTNRYNLRTRKVKEKSNSEDDLSEHLDVTTEKRAEKPPQQNKPKKRTNKTAKETTPIVLPRGIRQDVWTVLKMQWKTVSGPLQGVLNTSVFENPTKIIIQVSGASEMRVGINDDERLPWTLDQNLKCVIDTITKVATLTCKRQNFSMDFYWDGTDPKLSLMKKMLIETESNTICGFKYNTVEESFNSPPLKSVFIKHTKHNTNIKRHIAQPVIVRRTVLPDPRTNAFKTFTNARKESSTSNESIPAATTTTIRAGPVPTYDNTLNTVPKIQISPDTGDGIYISRLVFNNERNEVNEGFVLDGYVDEALPQSVQTRLQDIINQKRGHEAFAYTVDTAVNINMRYARAVIAEQHQPERSLWLSDEVMNSYIQLLMKVPHTQASNIHFHSQWTSVLLYRAFLLGNEELLEAARRVAQFSTNRYMMTNSFLSVMVVNLYSDHWYILLIYPQMKKIDCINSLATSQRSVNMLCHLLHGYFYAHTFSDSEFVWVPAEWKFCVIKPQRVPQQENGYDCGVFALRCLEYIVAGQQLAYHQNTIRSYRFKILYALRLQKIPWLSDHRNPLTEREMLNKLRENNPSTYGETIVLSPTQNDEHREATKHQKEARSTRKKLTGKIRDGNVANAESDFANAY
jgi:hypothetical protein